MKGSAGIGIKLLYKEKAREVHSDGLFNFKFDVLFMLYLNVTPVYFKSITQL